MTEKFVIPFYAFLIANFMVSTPLSQAAPKLKPGSIRDTFNTEICSHDWKSGTFSFGGTDITFCKHLVNGGGTIQLPEIDGECMLVVTEGHVTAATGTGGEPRPLSVKDCLLMNMKDMCTLMAGNDSSVIVDLRFTTRKRNQGNPSLSPGDIVNIDHLQFCQPEKGIDARVIETGYGQVSFVRLERSTTFPGRKSGIERFLYISRGDMSVIVDGEKSDMTIGDVLYLGADNTVSYTTGSRGCDLLAAVCPGDAAISRAHNKRMAAFHSIVAPGTEPALLIDGETEKPGLTMTEGPSWMNGRFYFSNYYKYWKPWGSSDEGGVWVVEQDGSYRILNKNIQTCGTTPLSNGMLAVCDLFARAVIEMDPRTGEMGREIVGSYNGVPFAVANDVITDTKGGLYITDSSVAKEGPKQPGTALYYHNSDGKTIRVTEPNSVEYINGVMLTPDDRTLFLNGSGEIYVWAFDVNPDGTLRNKRPFAKLLAPDSELDREAPRSVADGMTIDRDLNIYVATSLGIQVFDRTGSFAGIISFPRTPSHCVFGGPEMKTLYVTARKHIYSIRTLRTGFQYPIEQ